MQEVEDKVLMSIILAESPGNYDAFKSLKSTRFKTHKYMSDASMRANVGTEKREKWSKDNRRISEWKL